MLIIIPMMYYLNKKSITAFIIVAFLISIQKGLTADLNKTLNATISEDGPQNSLLIQNLNENTDNQVKESLETDIVQHQNTNAKKQENVVINPKNQDENRIINVKISSEKEAKSKNPNTNLAKVNNLLALRQNKQAESLLDNTVPDLDSDCFSLAQAASLYEKMKKYNKANDLYEQALLYSPNRIEVLYNYSLSLNKSHQANQAKKIFNKITSINPAFMLAHYNLGNIYYRQGNYNKALEAFAKSARINPLSSDSYYNLGLTLEKMNYNKLALKYYENCLQLNPEDEQAQTAVIRLKSIG